MPHAESGGGAEGERGRRVGLGVGGWSRKRQFGVGFRSTVHHTVDETSIMDELGREGSAAVAWRPGNSRVHG